MIKKIILCVFTCAFFTINAQEIKCKSTSIKTEISTNENIRTVKSKYSFDETVKRLSETITAKGMTIFATINHTEAAQKVGLTMQPAVVLIFGNPKAGTPLMQKDPLFALQLPLKVLITEVNGEVLVSFTKTKSLVKDSNIPYSDVENTLAKVEGLIVGSLK